MRKYTNKYNYPEIIQWAVEADPYDKGNTDFSITELISPAQIRHLERVYKDVLTPDIDDMLYSLDGQILHGIFERAGQKNNKGRYILEKRFFSLDIPITKLNKSFKFSGQIDVYDTETRTLTDYKYTTKYKFKNQAKLGTDWIPKEWIAQLNMQAFLMKYHQGFDPAYEVDNLQICGILRDFSKPEAMRDDFAAQNKIVVVDIPKWSEKETLTYIQNRIYAHINIPPCSSEERWAEPYKYAVMKKGYKKAVRLFTNELEANEMIAFDEQLFIEGRPESVGRRCEMYCSVSKYCKQYKLLKYGGKYNDEPNTDTSPG